MKMCPSHIKCIDNSWKATLIQLTSANWRPSKTLSLVIHKIFQIPRSWASCCCLTWRFNLKAHTGSMFSLDLLAAREKCAYCCYISYSPFIPSSYSAFVLFLIFFLFFFIKMTDTTAPSRSERNSEVTGHSSTVKVSWPVHSQLDAQ